jgi:hypothetical protein
MKTRNGFVSNSSTSSFIIVTTKEAHEKAISQLVPWELKVVEEMMSEGKLGNQEVYYGYNYSGMGGEGTMDWLAGEVKVPKKDEEKKDENGFTGVYAAWDKYLGLLDDPLTFDAGDGG